MTNDISRAVKEAKEQSIIFKKDNTAIVHVGLGKVYFVVPMIIFATFRFIFKEFHAALIFRLMFKSHLQLSITEDALRANIGAFENARLLAKPAGLKKSKC